LFRAAIEVLNGYCCVSLNERIRRGAFENAPLLAQSESDLASRRHFVPLGIAGFDPKQPKNASEECADGSMIHRPCSLINDAMMFKYKRIFCMLPTVIAEEMARE
jgi:hypothetical protein